MASLEYTNKQKLQQELIVYGFIRDSHNNNDIFPMELSQICLSFYLLIKDKLVIFQKIKSTTGDYLATDFSIQDDNTVKCINKTDTSGGGLINGSILVDKGNIQTWKIKIIEAELPDGKDLLMIFGIVSKEHNTKYGLRKDGRLIHVDDDLESQSESKDYCKPFDATDTVEMILDMKSNQNNGVLSFNINGEDQGIAYDIVDINKEYFMTFAFASFPNSTVIIQLLQD